MMVIILVSTSLTVQQAIFIKNYNKNIQNRIHECIFDLSDTEDCIHYKKIDKKSLPHKNMDYTFDQSDTNTIFP